MVQNDSTNGVDALGLWNIWNPFSIGAPLSVGQNPWVPWDDSAQLRATHEGLLAGAYNTAMNFRTAAERFGEMSAIAFDASTRSIFINDLRDLLQLLRNDPCAREALMKQLGEALKRPFTSVDEFERFIGQASTQGALDVVTGLGIARYLKEASEVARAAGKISHTDLVRAAERARRAADSAAPHTVLSGHGGLIDGAGQIEIPYRTSLTTWTEHGNTITDNLGNAIETGRPITYAEFGDEITGARTYLPGSSAPNYTLFPPDGLSIMGNPITVKSPKQLSSLLRPNMGNVSWAACLCIE
jgi:hypothetical protein